MTEASSDLQPDAGAGVDAQRLENLRRLQASGCQLYASEFAAPRAVGEVRAAFAESQPVRAAGRLVTIRNMGKSIFADLQDATGRMQIYVGRANLPPEQFEAFRLLDIGDMLGVQGTMFTTRMGEPTIRVDEWRLLAKALRPLPEKWHGLRDVELRYRKRYLDLIANAGARDVFARRAEIIRAVRSFLWDRGFVEVETPMMQPQPGGAAARPFQTHYTALNADMFLRIAPELYLKRLLVGGLPRVFELNRNFRNEGLSRNHNPEFTMLEAYVAWSDRLGVQRLVQEMIQAAARQVCGGLQAGSPEHPLDLSGTWRETAYRDLVRECMGDDWFALPPAEARTRAQQRGLAVDPAWDHLLITHEVYEKLIERTLINPTFVTRLPRQLVPLARCCSDDPELVDVFELVINGMEIAPGYSELNDPAEQRRRFAEQAGADAQQKDEDFLTALEYGMPPAGGLGLGIDRLVMVLTGAETIRDVILFPQLRTLETPV